MNVASLDLCKELYELSGWDQTFNYYEYTDSIPEGEPYLTQPEPMRRYGLWTTQEVKKRFPAYDLGYLLRKLPSFIYSTQYEQKAYLWTRKDSDKYCAWYKVTDPNYGEDITSEHGFVRDTPEDAVILLAIELFKRKVL